MAVKFQGGKMVPVSGKLSQQEGGDLFPLADGNLSRKLERRKILAAAAARAHQALVDAWQQSQNGVGLTLTEIDWYKKALEYTSSAKQTTARHYMSAR